VDECGNNGEEGRYRCAYNGAYLDSRLDHYKPGKVREARRRLRKRSNRERHDRRFIRTSVTSYAKTGRTDLAARSGKVTGRMAPRTAADVEPRRLRNRKEIQPVETSCGRENGPNARSRSKRMPKSKSPPCKIYLAGDMGNARRLQSFRRFIQMSLMTIEIEARRESGMLCSVEGNRRSPASLRKRISSIVRWSAASGSKRRRRVEIELKKNPGGRGWAADKATRGRDDRVSGLSGKKWRRTLMEIVLRLERTFRSLQGGRALGIGRGDEITRCRISKPWPFDCSPSDIMYPRRTPIAG